METRTPMIMQYLQIKERYKDCILFFRLGDFYEMFYEDAELASKVLELMLTGRDAGGGERAPMCGVPHHSTGPYIEKLVSLGYKVAICEQVSEPGKGLVQRDVVRVITPGTIVEPNMLDEGKNNFIASIHYTSAECALSFADVSTGSVHVARVDGNDLSSMQNHLMRFSPSEIVVNEDFLDLKAMERFIATKLTSIINLRLESEYDVIKHVGLINRQFSADVIKQTALLDHNSTTHSVGALLSYLTETQKIGVSRLVTVETISGSRYMNIDIYTRKNLELVSTMRTGEKKGTLLWVMDKTKTSMGKRLLRLYIEQPLLEVPEIEARLETVGELVSNFEVRMNLSDELSGIFDLERLLTRVICRNITPRELKSFGMALLKIPALKEQTSKLDSALAVSIHNSLHPLTELATLIEEAVEDKPPATLKDGGVIKDGFFDELDELRAIVGNSKEIIIDIENRERAKTGIKTLKIAYNRVFGYFIEVTRANSALVPEHYVKKQTLANSERYITEELDALEEKILTASGKIATIEARIYSDIMDMISAHNYEITETAAAIAKTDVFVSLAELASDNNYCRPTINNSGTVKIVEGRHPVVENTLNDGSYFVPNDTELRSDSPIAIITGPNMAGKSTYIRQVALICLMAQIGSFVPAREASLSVVDSIFTRIGASDDLASGMSTFMVEMQEVAYILEHATKDSLLILDEVGRGTSTFDGMSIARAILEYIADKSVLGAKTLFATHYHELTDMETDKGYIKNYNTAVKKLDDGIQFLRKIVPGAVDDSYGIEVSKLAGIPNKIISRANDILSALEEDSGKSASKLTTAIASLRATDIGKLSHEEALLKLAELKELSGQ